MNIKDYTNEQTNYFLGEVRFVRNLHAAKSNNLLSMGVRKGVFAERADNDLVVCLDMVDTEEKAQMADVALRKNRDDDRFVFSTAIPNQINRFFVIRQKEQKFSDDQRNLVTNFKRMVKNMPDIDKDFVH